MTREKKVRMYANHLALTVRSGNGAFKLVERYNKKRVIGTYRSLGSLKRGIDRFRDWALRELHANRDPYSAP
jgi:hypothetical protein